MTGASIGWMAGSLVGSMFTPGQKSQGPRLGDLSVTSAAYGAVIPWCAGSPRVAGVIAWASDKIEIPTTTETGGKGGSGGSYTSYRYEVDVLILLSANPYPGVYRIWRNGELIWSAVDDADPSTIAASDASNAWTNLEFYSGESYQTPDPNYEAAVTTALAPAYRGRASVFIKGLQLGESGAIPNLTFELKNAYRGDHIPGDGLTRLQSTFAGASAADISGYNVPVTLNAPVGQCAATVYDGYLEIVTMAVAAEAAPVGCQWDDTSIARQASGTALTVEWFMSLQSRPNPRNITSTWHVFLNNLTSSMQGGSAPFVMRTNGGYVDTPFASFSSTYGGIQEFDIYTPALFGLVRHSALVWQTDNTCSFYHNGVRLWTFNDSSRLLGAPTPTIRFGPVSQPNYWTDIVMRYYGIRVRRAAMYSGASFSPPTSPAIWGIPSLPEAPPEYVPPNFFYLEFLHDVVEALLIRAGLTADQFDISVLAETQNNKLVRSLALSQVSSTRTVLEMLALCYNFMWCGGNKLYARMRGGDPVVTIPWDDLGADGNPDRLPLRMGNELEVPAQIAITYQNVSNDYQSDTQLSDRILATQVSTETMEVPLGFLSTEAKKIADSLILDKVIGMTTATIALGREYNYLQPGDVVLVLDEAGNTWRMLITRIDDTLGVRKCDLRMDDATIWTQEGLTTEGTQGQSVVLAPPETTLELLDIPLLTDAGNSPGIYAAVSGNNAAWSFAGIYGSLDNTTYTLSTTITDGTAIGTCSTTLGNWSGGNVFDESNSVTVNVGAVETLSSYSRDDILIGAAPGYLVGSEVLYARTATLSSPGVYTLSGLLRGRHGTEWAMTGHVAAERFVRLSSTGMSFIPLNAGDLAGLRYYKGVSNGQRVSAVTAETITPLGITLKPFAPVNARVNRDAADHIITWNRRTRLSTRLTGGLPISCPLGEASESYEVEIFASSAHATAGTPVVRTITATAQTCTYTSAQRTTDGTGSTVVYMRVYQLSAAVGRGYPLITSN